MGTHASPPKVLCPGSSQPRCRVPSTSKKSPYPGKALKTQHFHLSYFKWSGDVASPSLWWETRLLKATSSELLKTPFEGREAELCGSKGEGTFPLHRELLQGRIQEKSRVEQLSLSLLLVTPGLQRSLRQQQTQNAFCSAPGSEQQPRVPGECRTEGK